MAELLIDISKRAFPALILVGLLGYLFPEILSFGENEFQTGVVFAFFVYCGIALFGSSPHKFFHVLSIPVLTQFLHLFQKYAFTAGANSLWRLLPFILTDIYFIYFFSCKNPELSRREKAGLLSWVFINTIFIMISPSLDHIAWGSITLIIITLPLYFCYLGVAVKAIDFQVQIEKYLSIVFLILGIGTFGLALAGTAYKGSDNLLVTRNITDTNVTMAYFILLWPFVLFYCHRSNVPQLIRFAYLAIFSGIVIISFSRGALFIIIPYIIMSVGIFRKFIHTKWLVTPVMLLYAFSDSISAFWDNQDLAYFWKLRFGDIFFTGDFSGIQQTSGRAAIHEIAYALFLQKPLFGHGTGSFEMLGPGYREAHSMFFTLLAEQGLVGSIYLYGILILLGKSLMNLAIMDRRYILLLMCLIFYIIFNHTVGCVFVIIPAKSVTVNCIAPILLICLYFYGRARLHPAG